MRTNLRLRDLILPCLDGGIAVGSVLLAFVARFDPAPAFQGFRDQLLAMAILAALLKPALLAAFGVYPIYWGYVGIREILRLLVGVITGSNALALSVSLLQSPLIWLRGIPSSIFYVDFLVAASGISAVRLTIHARLRPGACRARRRRRPGGQLRSLRRTVPGAGRSTVWWLGWWCGGAMGRRVTPAEGAPGYRTC